MFKKSWSHIWQNLKDGVWEPFIAYFYRLYFSLRDHDGIQMMDEDWDYLIILDACRYDAFEQTNWIDGDLSKKTSPGTATYEWRDKTFDKYHGNTIYISANPYISKRDGFDPDDYFYKTRQLFLNDEYQEAGITKPEAVTNEALQTHADYPNKKLIIHYMQPHDPFIAEPQISMKAGDVEEVHDHFKQDNSWKAYIANLERALRSIEDLLDELEGKIVITADHGECFGELGLTRHTDVVYIDALTDIPWLEIDNGPRPQIIDDETADIDI